MIYACIVTNFLNDLIDGYEEITGNHNYDMVNELIQKCQEYGLKQGEDKSYSNMGLLADRLYHVFKNHIAFPEILVQEALEDYKNKIADMVADIMWQYDLLATGKDEKDLDAEIWNRYFRRL